MIKLIEIAEEFGRIIWPIKKDLQVNDLILYGSLAYEAKKPKDVDIMVIHHNPILDKLEIMIKENKFITDQEVFSFLTKSIKNFNLRDIIRETSIEEAIKKGKFHTVYINSTFFYDPEYQKKWRIMHSAKNKDINKTKKWGNERFEETALRFGLLWNPQTKKYDLPANLKYKITKL